MNALQGNFCEITSAEQLKGLSGDIWVVGVDTDPAPYGDGKAKILSHQATGRGRKFEQDDNWQQFLQWCAFIDGRIASGCRVFFYENDCEDGVTDRYGLPLDPLHKKVIEEAKASFVTK